VPASVVGASGTGNDGTAGLESIKPEGGIRTGLGIGSKRDRKPRLIANARTITFHIFNLEVSFRLRAEKMFRPLNGCAYAAVALVDRCPGAFTNFGESREARCGF